MSFPRFVCRQSRKGAHAVCVCHLTAGESPRARCELLQEAPRRLRARRGPPDSDEHGIYTLLLDWYYVHESPIPDAMAHRIARSNREETQSVLSEFFALKDDCWHHRRCDAEIAEYRKQAEKNRANGSAGGRPAKTQWVPSGNPSETDEKATGNLSHKPLAINQEKEEAKKPPAPSARSAVELQTWIDSLPADEQPIPGDDPIIDYAEKAGIPYDYLLICWEEFCERMQGKRQKDWRAHYRNAVRGNWFKLWWMRDGGEWRADYSGRASQKEARAMIDLKRFCAVQDGRKYLRAPFSTMGGTAASDGFIVVWADQASDAPAHDCADKMIAKAKAEAADPDAQWIDANTIRTSSKECPECDDGTGRVEIDECPECDGYGEFDHGSHTYSCKECGGSGEIVAAGSGALCEECGGAGKSLAGCASSYGAVSDTGGPYGYTVSSHFIERMRELPGCMVRTYTRPPRDGIAFKFGGGCGIVMPLATNPIP